MACQVFWERFILLPEWSETLQRHCRCYAPTGSKASLLKSCSRLTLARKEVKRPQHTEAAWPMHVTASSSWLVASCLPQTSRWQVTAATRQHTYTYQACILGAKQRARGPCGPAAAGTYGGKPGTTSTLH